MNKVKNIFIVDDDSIYQFTMKLTLRALDNIGEVNFFNDGLEAIDYIKANSNNPEKLPDIIFLDINMPVMDGYQFIEEYQELKTTLDKKIAIYMLSSSIDPIDTKKVEQISDVSDYLIKPLMEDILNSIIHAKKEN